MQFHLNVHEQGALEMSLASLPNEVGGGLEQNQSAGHDWPYSASAHMSRCYHEEDQKLNALYNKAKSSQWDARVDINWSTELDPDNPVSMHDGTIVLFGTPIWDTLDAKTRIDVRRHAQGWMMSQILHGEQAALLCASKLAMSERTVVAKMCNAMQACDEARHVEAFSALSQKIGIDYPMTHSLGSLLKDTVQSSETDITNLGMQILVEGIALSIFQTVVAYSSSPFIKDLFNRIKADEARHFAVGRITLKRISGELSESELRVRDEFISEGANALYEHLCADEIWGSVNLPRLQCAQMVREAPVAVALRRSLFRRLVPSIRDMGFLRPRVIKTFEQLGVMDYSAFPVFDEA
jgi:hypothetical protein